MNFSQFCSCGAEGYAQLKAGADRCARLGRSYEFRGCRMPPGCLPETADLGFWLTEGGYLLYFRPAVAYWGECPALAAFFGHGALHCFPTFQALAAALDALGPEVSAPAPSEGGSLFRQLEHTLGGQVVGQARAVEGVAFKVYGHICKSSPARPLSLIFYGPTCVGKSELAKALAPALNRCLGQCRYRTLWTELNTFTQAHSAYRLTGAPPGYVGYGDPPILERVEQNPYTVFVFDELDKAHPEVLKVFMSILDEGRCASRRPASGGQGELDFRRCIFVFTTNADLSSPGQRPLGFAPPSCRKQQKAAPPAGPAGLAQRLLQEDETARRGLTRSGVLVEISGRFSGLIGFQPLDQEARWAVTARQIAALGREYGLTITWVAPAIARALTPEDTLSLRSTPGVLEGVLTPLFMAWAGRVGEGPFHLDGSPGEIRLSPQRGSRAQPRRPTQMSSSSTIPLALSKR